MEYLYPSLITLSQPEVGMLTDLDRPGKGSRGVQNGVLDEVEKWIWCMNLNSCCSGKKNLSDQKAWKTLLHRR